MELDKTIILAASPDAIWKLLLDPKVMGRAVPGMQSIEVVSDTEYLAVMVVKIAFITAKFKLRTLVTQQRAPHYLQSQGTGEDSSVASSLKQTSEIFLTAINETQNGNGNEPQTELRIKVKAQVLGRLGTFGLSAMKTKADRLWDEFGQNFAAILAAYSADERAPLSV